MLPKGDLIHLSVSNNRLTTISVIDFHPCLHSLKILNLSQNKLSTCFEAISHCVSLKDLNVSNNMIADSDLQYVLTHSKVFPKLKKLDLACNVLKSAQLL